METNLYKFNYDLSVEEDTKTLTLKLDIPNFIWLLENQTNREICIDKTVDYTDQVSKDSRILIKINFKGKQNGLIDFYFLVPVSVFAKYELSNNRNKILDSKQHYSWVHANKWQYMTSHTKAELLSNMHQSYATTLNLVYKFMMLVTRDYEDYYIWNNEPKTNINSDLKYLLKESIFSDVTVKSIEGVEFRAHKVILIARSSVLKAHFEHNTKEKLTNTIESPFETEVLQEILNYIYSDEVVKLDEIPEKLLAGADFYQLSGLKDMCEKALYKKLSVENAIETLELAYLHTSLGLKRRTIEFINDGISKDVIRTKGWSNLQSGQLIKDIYEHHIINN